MGSELGNGSIMLISFIWFVGSCQWMGNATNKNTVTFGTVFNCIAACAAFLVPWIIGIIELWDQLGIASILPIFSLPAFFMLILR
jgi:hypothetical protein